MSFLPGSACSWCKARRNGYLDATKPKKWANLEDENPNASSNDLLIDVASVASSVDSASSALHDTTYLAHDMLLNAFHSFAPLLGESILDSLIRLHSIVEKLNCHEEPKVPNEEIIKKIVMLVPSYKLESNASDEKPSNTHILENVIAMIEDNIDDSSPSNNNLLHRLDELNLLERSHEDQERVTCEEWDSNDEDSDDDDEEFAGLAILDNNESSLSPPPLCLMAMTDDEDEDSNSEASSDDQDEMSYEELVDQFYRTAEVVFKTKKQLKTLEASHLALQESYDKLNVEHGELGEKHKTLEASHLALQESYDKLNVEYGELGEEHKTLKASHLALQESHNKLKIQHGELGEKHKSLEVAFEATTKNRVPSSSSCSIQVDIPSSCDLTPSKEVSSLDEFILKDYQKPKEERKMVMDNFKRRTRGRIHKEIRGKNVIDNFKQKSLGSYPSSIHNIGNNNYHHGRSYKDGHSTRHYPKVTSSMKLPNTTLFYGNTHYKLFRNKDGKVLAKPLDPPDKTRRIRSIWVPKALVDLERKTTLRWVPKSKKT